MKLPRAFVSFVAPLLFATAIHGADFDSDADGDVDLADAAAFVDCLHGPGSAITPECAGNYDGDGDVDVDLADFQAFQIVFGRIGTAQVERLTFAGTSYHTVAIDCPSGSCSFYGTPHWLDQNLDGDADDPGDHKYPVAYIRGTTAGISGLAFNVVPADLELVGVPVIGTGPDGLLWEGTGTVSDGELVVTGTLSSAVPLPNMVVFYDTLDIEWQVALDGVNFYAAGTSDSPVYVAYADPLGDRLESYFSISTNAAQGQDEEQAVIDAIWAEFTDRYVVNAYGEVLGYYRGILCAGDCTYYSAPELVYYTNSQCGGWADLMIQCLRTQGLGGAQFITIEPRSTPTLPLDCGSYPMSAAGFLVKNYQFSGSGAAPCPAYPFRFNDPCAYYPSWPQADVVDMPGIAGQDNGNPASWFARHFIVKINMKYYDPSYGAGPFSGTTDQATMAWEGGAIAGYFGTAEASTGRAGVRKDVPQLRETYFDQ